MIKIPRGKRGGKRVTIEDLKKVKLDRLCLEERKEIT